MATIDNRRAVHRGCCGSGIASDLQNVFACRHRPCWNGAHSDVLSKEFGKGVRAISSVNYSLSILLSIGWVEVLINGGIASTRVEGGHLQ